MYKLYMVYVIVVNGGGMNSSKYVVLIISEEITLFLNDF